METIFVFVFQFSRTARGALFEMRLAFPHREVIDFPIKQLKDGVLCHNQTEKLKYVFIVTDRVCHRILLLFFNF